MPERQLGDFVATDLSSEWSVVQGLGEAAELEAELEREVSAGHVLCDRAAVAVAIRRHRKEAIFWLSDRSEWALVHLTWSAESDPRWPSTEIHGTWADVTEDLSDRRRS